MKIAIMLVLVLSLMFVGCTSGRVYQDGTVGDVKPQTIEKETPVSPVKTGLSANPEVVKLYARQGQIKSYSFDLARLPDRRGSATYFVKGDFARVKPPFESVSSRRVDNIYLNFAKSTAVGYCDKSSTCTDPNSAIPLSYSDWEVPLPISWADDAQYGKIAGTVTYFSRPVTRVQYQKGALYYEVYIDNYFGYPLRVAIATDQDFKDIIGGYEYRNIAFNVVQDKDVTYTPVLV